MNTSHLETSSGTKKKKGESFFTLDRRIWGIICDVGDVNLAATYLTIAQGVCGVHSKWSAKSVWKYAGIGRPRAAKHIDQLVESGFLRLGPNHTALHPQYAVTPYNKLLCRPDATDSTSQQVAADTLWLPSTLIQGLGENESSPLSKLVATQDILPLRILVELYSEQNLVADGGIDRRVLHDEYERQRVGERGKHVVWAFTPTGLRCGEDTDRWKRFHTEKGAPGAFDTLFYLGLLSCIEHLTQSDSMDSEIVHALPRLDRQGPLENETLVACTAFSAAWLLLTPDLRNKVESGPLRNALMVPVKRHLTKVHCFGIFRLVHRPHTKLTAEWALQSQRRAETYVPLYRQLSLEGNRAEERAIREYVQKVVKSA